MTESLGVYDIEIEADKAKQELATLQAMLGVIDDYKPPANMFEALQRDLERAKQKVSDLAKEEQRLQRIEDEHYKLWIANTTRENQELARQAQLKEQAAAREQERVNAESRKISGERGEAAKKTLLQAIGGDELPEKVGDISKAFAAVGDSTLSWTTRLSGLAGGIGLAVPVIGSLAGVAATVLERFGVLGTFTGWIDNLQATVRGVESTAQAAARQASELSQLQIAQERMAVYTQKLNDETDALKDSFDAVADRIVTNGKLGEAFKQQALADYTAIQNWETLKDTSAQLAVGIDLTTLAEQRATEATERQAQATEYLRRATEDAAKAQGDLSYAVRANESAADRITRIFRGTRLRAEQIILENRERRQIARAERQALSRQGYRANEINEALGSLGYSAPSSGPNQALLQARQEAAAAITETKRFGVAMEEVARKGNTSLITFYHALRDAAREALTAQQSLNEKLQAEIDIGKQLLQSQDSKARAQEAINEQVGNEHKQRLEASERAYQEALDDQNRLRIQAQEAQDIGKQFSLSFGQNASITRTAAQNLANSAAEAFGTAQQAFQSHFAAWINGREDIATAGKAMLNETLTQIASEAAPRAIFETAQGIAALATYRYGEAGQHFAAAGLYASLAVGAGAGAYASSSSVSAQSSKGFSSPASAQSPSKPDSRESGDIVINYYGGTSLDTQDTISQAVVKSIDRAATLGYVPRTMLRAFRQ